MKITQTTVGCSDAIIIVASKQIMSVMEITIVETAPTSTVEVQEKILENNYCLCNIVNILLCNVHSEMQKQHVTIAVV